MDVVASLTNCGSAGLPWAQGGACPVQLVIRSGDRAYAWEDGGLRRLSANGSAGPLDQCAIGAVSSSIAPGETKTVSFSWNGTVPSEDCTPPSGVHGTASVCGTQQEDSPAGDWQVEASYALMGAGATTYRWSASQTIQVQPRAG